MLKSALTLVIGVLAGAVASFLLLGRDGPATGGGGSLLDSIAVLGNAPAAAGDRPSVAARLETYREALAEDDPGGLRQRLAAAAAAPWSPARDVKIDALLVRLSELAPAQAVTAALELELDTSFVAEAFQRWAEADRNAALASLGSIGSAPMRRAVALALLAVVGDGEAGADRLAAALPAPEQDRFRVEWLSRLAESEPFAALRFADRIADSATRNRALGAVAVSWAGQDPAGALQQAESLPIGSARSFRTALMSEWALTDASGFLAWVEGRDLPPEEVLNGLSIAVIGDPERALRVADDMSGIAGQTARSLALRALADSDPEAVMARADAMPPGQERNQLLQAVGNALARRDPEAAVEWARSLSPPVPDVMTSVAMAIAQTDIVAALDLVDEGGTGIQSQLMLSMMLSSAGREAGEARQLAERLKDRDDPQSVAALRSLVGNWMERDAEEALDWVLANDAGVDRNVLSGAAQAMARRDPAAAAAFVDRIPQRFRDTWISQVAGEYGRVDPMGAMGWVARFQGQAGYDIAVREIISSAASNEPRTAARLLEQVSPEVQLGAASRVASGWAQQEPRAAADWAMDLADTRARAQAVAIAVGVWAGSEPERAASWVLELESGELRDQALRNLLTQQAAATGDIDADILGSFSDANMRQTALASALPMLARSDPERAREMLAEEITDPALRRQIEQQIDRMADPPSVVLPSGVFF